MPNLIHLIYVSTAIREFSAEDLLQLLYQSRAKNACLGLTGMLLYTENNFFQILEGEPAVVDELFHTISQDERHMKTITIIREPISKRSFGEWTMGFAAVTSADLQDMTGLNDFFGDGSSFAQLSTGRAKKLLNAFKDGRWRSKLNVPILELVG
ncbi:MAG: BLUF domain-containing protein [Chloroflexota bacterium]